MVERVAKAIALALGYNAADWRDFELHARAAINEMREIADAERPQR